MDTNNILTEPRLNELGWVQYFTTTKLAGNFREEKDSNNFFKQIRIDFCNIVSAEQVHCNEIKYIKDTDRGKKIQQTDGLVTNYPNIPLIIFTADCAPIAIIDTNTKTIALLHAGRKGTEKQIVTKAYELMSNINECSGEDCLAVIGPHIHSCCYPVDITELNIQQLLSIGIKKGNIIVSPYCTGCRTDLFFSYRKENKTTGRIITLLMKKGE